MRNTKAEQNMKTEERKKERIEHGITEVCKNRTEIIGE